MHLRLPRRPFRSPSRTNALLTAALLAAPAFAQAAPQFAELARTQLPAPPQRDWTSMVLGDVDGDGDLDLVCANGGGQTSLYVNDGTGAFVDVTAGQMPVEPFLYTSGVALGDVDGDGDPDLVLAGGLLQLYQNDGSGAFVDVSAAQLPVAAGGGGVPALGDVDGDGDLDIFFWPVGTPKGLLLNDGSGTFTDVTAAQLPPGYFGGDFLVDVDGDGDLDAVGPRAVWLNDGGGFFTDVTSTHLQLAQTGYLYWAAAVGDVDGDGDVDLAVVRQPCGAFPCGGWPAEIVFCLNDGAGVFSVATTPSVITPDAIRVIELGDVDGDGDLDLVVGTFPAWWGSPPSPGAPNRLYLNDGSAAFTDATAARMPGDAFVDTPYQAVAFGDVDGDGDPDLIWGGGQPNRLHLNLQRQLHAPAAPQLGQPYTLDAYLRYGPSSAVDLAVIYLSTGPASIPLQPFGTLGIDPAMAAPFPVLTIPQPAGVGSVHMVIPNVPGLVGQSLYSQAMLVAFPNDLRLSNVVVDVIQ